MGSVNVQQRKLVAVLAWSTTWQLAPGWKDGAWHDCIPNNWWVFDEFQLAVRHAEATPLR